MFRKYIADRKFYREVFIIVTPIILQYFIQHFINFIDNIMVGRMDDGEVAVAAVAVANQYYKLFYPAIVSICTAAAIFTAQYYGMNRKKELQKVFGFKLVFPMIITIGFMAIGFIFTEEIIRFFITDNETAVLYGIEYMKIALWSYIPLTISAAFTFTLRPIKMMKVPMIASSVGMCVNLVLNYLLIYGIWIFPELGVKGAAIGTVIARSIELSIYIIIFIKKDFPFKTRIFRYLKIDLNLSMHIFKKVIPLFSNEMAYSLALVVIFFVYSQSGTSAIAAVNISDVVKQVVYILVSGTGTATSILVGYKIGTGKIKEAEQNANYLLGYSVMMGFVIMAIICVAAFIVPHLYTLEEAETARIITYLLIIQGLVAPVIMFTRIPFFALRTGGRVWEIFILDGVFMWLVKVPIALLLGLVFNMNIVLLFLVVEATRVLNAFVSMYFYNQKKWLKRVAN